MTPLPEASPRRAPLTRDRVISAAVALADREGVPRLTIRALSAELDVKPMTLYHHVANKEAILDGIVDRVLTEIDAPPTGVDWREAIRLRCISVRAVLAAHPWATPLMETRTSPGPATLDHHEAVLACLRRGGLTVALTAHAYAVLDAFVHGFALQEAGLPFEGQEQTAGLAEQILSGIPEHRYPYLTELTREHVLRPGYDFGASFTVGLDLLLDGLSAAAAEEALT